MKNSHHKITSEKWGFYNREYQLQSLAAELARIASSGLRYGVKDKIVLAAYERLFELIDLTVKDPKWKNDLKMLFTLRDAAATGYIGENNPAAVANALQCLLLTAADLMI